MAKSITKKKNRKLRRQIRKTVGALFMASAIVVGAIPVQDVSADPSTSSGKVQVLNYTDKNMSSYNAMVNDTGCTLSSTILSACESKVPYVDESATIYTTGDGMFQFAFIKPSATAADEVAVILGANVTNLPGNSLTIPETVDAYKKYTANTTSSGYCAVSRSDKYLYYKKSVHKTNASNYPLYEVPGLTGTADDPGEITEFHPSLSKISQNEDGTWYMVYRYDTHTTDEEGNPIYQELEVVPIKVDSCVPCYYNSYSEWKNLSDNQLYYWNGIGPVDAYDLSSFSLAEDVDNQRIHEAEVQYIGRQYLIPNDSGNTNQSEWKIGGLVTESNPDKGVFAGKGQIVNLTVGSKLLGIGDYAFYGCSGLDMVSLGNGLSTIGNGAFADCVNMKQCNMELNSQIAAIGKRAFSNCRGLTDIVIPVNVKVIGDYCFEGCDGLQSIDLCGSGSNVLLEVIGLNAFINCSRLTSITFPDNYIDCENASTGETGIPITYFSGCTSLQYVKVQNSEFTFIEENHTDSLNCDIGNFLKTVPEIFYFEGPDVSAIHTTAKKHSAAFKYLNEDKFEKVVWCPETEYDTTTGNIIAGTGHEATFIVDSSNRLIDMEIDSDCGIVEIPANIGAYGIETIGSNSFQNNCLLRKIIIPSTVKYIEDKAFKGCHNLEHVIFSEPINIVSIGTDAFDTQSVDVHKTSCTNKSTFLSEEPELSFTGTISPDSVPFQYAMDPNNSINEGAQPKTHITYYSGWPTNLTVRYNQDTDKNELIDYPRYDELENYEEWKKDSDPLAGKITYPDMTKEYATAANGAVSAYESYLSGTGSRPTEDQMNVINSALNINLPAGIESIKSGLFSGMKENEETGEAEAVTDMTVNTDIESVTMNTVEEIEPYTFMGCKKLNGFYMSGGNEIGNYAFKDCVSLENANVADSVSELGIRPFVGCTALQNVNFGNNPNFTCNGSIIYGLDGGTKTSIIECLETRGSLSGSYSVGPEELTGIAEIREEAFMDCAGIGKVDLTMTSVDVIPEKCFQNTKDLNSVVLPDTVKSIESESFGNSGLRLLTIPGTQSYIAQDAFMTGDWVKKPSDRETDPKTTESAKQQSIIFECIEGTTADRYAREYWYITPEYGKVYLEHAVYFWNYPNYPNTTDKAIFHEVKVKDGEDAVPPTTGPTVSGYDFVGWTNYQNISKDTDVWPIYSDETFEVAFYDWDGSLISKEGFINPQIVGAGKSATPPAENPTREGYTFVKWTPDYNNVQKDLTVIAQYKNNKDDDAKHTVVFYAYKDSSMQAISTQYIEDGKDATEPAVPERKGYTFIGWAPANFKGVTSDLTIVASYEKTSNSSASPSPTATSGTSSSSDSSASKKKYTVSVSGGSGSGSYAAGDIVAINAYYLGNGQNFDKWTTSTAGVGFANPSASSTTFTMPAANVSITATYKTGGSTTTTSGGTSSSGGSTNSSNASNSSTTVQVTKPGISNTNLAGATVSGATDNFVVKVSEDQSATDAVVAALQAKFGDISRIKYLAMDISLYDSTGRTKIADTSGISVNLTLPLPDELVQYAGNNKVAAISNGALEDLNARFTTVDGVPCVNFTASHFSPYVIYVDTANLTAGTIDATPQTGDPIHPKWFLSLGLACIALILFFKRDKAVIPAKMA